MAEKFVPDPITVPQTIEELVEYMTQQFARLQVVLGSPTEIPIFYAEPKKKTERMLVFADGVKWNPGSGTGLYILINGAWTPVQVGTAEQPIPLPPPPPPVEEPPPPVEQPPLGGPVFAFEGFGAGVTGGAGKPGFVVTSLANSGVGTLRDAISAGNRNITFAVAGTINLASSLDVTGANITVDGLSAPSPGITLRGHRMAIFGSDGAANVVVRGIRHRGHSVPNIDNFALRGVSGVVLDRISSSGFQDGNVDITDDSQNVSLQWSILSKGNPNHNFITALTNDARNISIHHCLYHDGEDRMPHIGRGDTMTGYRAEITADVRNNLIWQFGRGTVGRTYGQGNVVKNYYFSTRARSSATAIQRNDETVRWYVAENFSQNGWNINAAGNRGTPFSAAAIPSETDAITAAHMVRDWAGAKSSVWGLDSVDQAIIDSITGLAPRP